MYLPDLVQGYYQGVRFDWSVVLASLDYKEHSPTMNKGYMSVNEVPGLGVAINEKEAVKYPITTKSNWQVRQMDGNLVLRVAVDKTIDYVF